MKTCALCAKGSIVGGGYSNRVRATKFNPTGKRRRHPNLQWMQDGKGGRVKVCTSCLKTSRRV